MVDAEIKLNREIEKELRTRFEKQKLLEKQERNKRLNEWRVRSCCKTSVFTYKTKMLMRLQCRSFKIISLIVSLSELKSWTRNESRKRNGSIARRKNDREK